MDQLQPQEARGAHPAAVAAVQESAHGLVRPRRRDGALVRGFLGSVRDAPLHARLGVVAKGVQRDQAVLLVVQHRRRGAAGGGEGAQQRGGGGVVLRGGREAFQRCARRRRRRRRDEGRDRAQRGDVRRVAGGDHGAEADALQRGGQPGACVGEALLCSGGAEDHRVEVEGGAQRVRHHVVHACRREEEVRPHGAEEVACLGHHAGAEERARDVAPVARLRGGEALQRFACEPDGGAVRGVLHLGKHSSLDPLVGADEGAQHVHAVAQAHHLRRQVGGHESEGVAPHHGLLIPPVSEAGQVAARLFHLQADLGQLGAQEDERLGDILVRACDVDVVADGADEQSRPLLVRRLQDGVDAQAEEEGAERVALLLPGARLEHAKFAVLAPDRQMSRSESCV